VKQGLSHQPGQPGDKGYLAIGQVLRPQGLKGEVKVRPDTDEAARFLDFDFLYQKTGEETFIPIAIHDVSLRKGFVFLTLEEDDGVEAAEARRNLVLYIDRAHAAPWVNTKTTSWT